MRGNKYNVGDMFVDFEGDQFLFVMNDLKGEPEKQAVYPYILQSIEGSGVWDAWRSLESATEDIEVLVKERTMKHYSQEDYKLSISLK